MKISKINNIQIVNPQLHQEYKGKQQKELKSVEESSNKVTANYNIAFFGLFKKKSPELPLADVRCIIGDVPMCQDYGYLIDSSAKFELGTEIKNVKE